jgi:cytochrome P450
MPALGYSVTHYDDYIHEPNCQQLDHLPGNYGAPLIGHTFSYFRNPLSWAQRRYQRYGPVFKISTAGTRAVLCLGPDLIQRILLDPGQDFSSKMGFHDRLNKFFGNSFIMEDFEHHRFQRRIAQTAFKNESIRHYNREINRIYHHALDGWETDTGNVILFYPYIKNLLLTVAEDIFIGETERNDQVTQAFVDCAQATMYILPINLPGFALNRGLRGRAFLEQFVGPRVAQKRQGQGLDILSHFCREKDEYGQYFSDQNITNQMIFLLFAAHDTTTSAITSTIYYLARHPQVKEQLYQQCKALGKDELSYDDLDSLPYLQQVFNEVQRIRPSVPGVPRRTIREVELAGQRIPPHTLLYTLPRFTHWMEEYWTEPERFDPDRFSPERAEHKRHPFQFHPFGGGAHKCIGMHFAQMEYKCFIYQFMRRFDFEARHKKANVRIQTFPLPKPVDDMPILLTRR